MVTLILGDDKENSAYCDLSLPTANIKVAEKYTAFVRYQYSNDPDDTYIEEIDVVALSQSHAVEVAEAALARDYDTEPTPVIVDVMHRPRGIMYL